MGFLKKLFEKKREIKDFGPAKVYISAEGKRRGMPTTPLLIYGHSADTLAELISGYTTASCVSIYQLDFIKEYCSEYPSIGLIAQSRPEHNGEAGEALKLFRASESEKISQQIEPDPAESGLAAAQTLSATFYGAWDYNVHRAATRALEYQADGIIMPGMMDRDLFNYIFGVLNEIIGGFETPKTIDEHRERLKRYTTEASPFWKQEDLITSAYY